MIVQQAQFATISNIDDSGNNCVPVRTDVEIFPSNEENNTETEFGSNEVLKILDTVVGFLENAFKTICDGLAKLNIFASTKKDTNEKVKSEDDTNAVEFKKRDVDKLTNVIDNIPSLISGSIDVSEDDIQLIVNEIEKNGLENFIIECSNQYSDIISPELADEVINNLKEGDIDELYDNIMHALNEQTGLPVSLVVGKDLKASIKDALEMLSEKI